MYREDYVATHAVRDRAFAMWFALSLIGSSSGVHVADKLRHLSAKEIRSNIIGKVVTDESHWSDDFQIDGTLKVVDLGRHKMGAWRIEANELCLTINERQPPTQCFEIWMSHDLVQYHRNGVMVAEGYLRSHR